MEITLQEIHVFYSKCFKFSLSGATLRDTFEDMNQKGPKFMILEQMTVQNLTSGPKKNQNFIDLAKEKSVVMCLIMVSFLVKTQQNKLIKRFFTVLGQGKVLTNYVQIYHHYHLYFKEKFKNIFFFKNNSKIYKKGKNTQYC